MSKKRLKVVDLFCGAGGTSGGVYEAADELGESVDLVAVNHSSIAIATHKKNHSGARHLCESIESVRPRQVIPGGYLDLLVASPECTHHSIARGGVPMSEQSRSTAWAVLTWAQHLYVRDIIIENVPEFEKWGPLGRNGRPIESLRGETFRAYLRAFESLGYQVEYRILCTADYGDPTERRRLFIRCRRGRGHISWPKPTHDEFARNGLPKWRTFEDSVWDRSIPGRSIFNRSKPLATKTLIRIGAGIEEFGRLDITKFLVKLNGTGRHRSVERPMPTVTGHKGLAVGQAFLVQFNGTSKTRPTNRPIGSLTTKHRYAIVKVGKAVFGLDILFRMLTWRELARAMSFPNDFEFEGTDEQKVKQIGNAVPRKMARALAREALRRRN